MLAIVVPPVLLFFVVRSIWTKWDVISAHPWHVDLGWLLISAVAYLADIVLLIQLWRALLVIVSGKPLRFRTAYRISTLSNLGKYVPGKVWTIMGMIYLLQQEGLAASTALASTILHQAFTVIAGAVFVVIVLGTKIWGDLPAASVVIGLGLSVVVLYPSVFTRLLNFGLKLARREPVQIRLSFPLALGLFVGYVLAWVIYGISFWCMMRGLQFGGSPFWEIVAAFGAAYLIGFLALFAPGGLGVREGILTLLLAPYLPTGMAAPVALVSRLWMTLVELLGMAPLIPWFRRSPSKTAPANPAR